MPLRYLRPHLARWGFFWRGVIIFSFTEGKSMEVYSGLGSWRKRSGVGGDTCVRHAGSAEVRVRREGCCCLLDCSVVVIRDWLHYSLLGSQSQQHLLWSHQHPLTLFGSFAAAALPQALTDLSLSLHPFCFVTGCQRDVFSNPPTFSWTIAFS